MATNHPERAHEEPSQDDGLRLPPIPSRLSALPLAEGMGPAELDRLAELATPVHWEAGATIYREGDHDPLVYLVEEGHVALEVTVPGRGPVIVLTVGPCEVFGWSSLFYQRPKTAAARASVPTRALALDADRLRALCEADHDFGYTLTRRILAVVSDRVKTARIQLLDIFQ